MSEHEAEAGKPDRLISYRSDNIGRYKSNFVRTAVCELRFPLLPEIAGDAPPSVFVSALRKKYPQLERVNEFAIGPNGAASGSNVHLFRSLKAGWIVTLKQASVAVESHEYPGFDQYVSRILEVVRAAADIIDADFWTRVGLRYINHVPLDKANHEPTGNWIEPQLVSALDSGVFLNVDEYKGRIQGSRDDRGYLLQHGINREATSKGSTEFSYALDVDVWKSEVQLVDTEAVLHQLHDDCFAIFDWAIGPDAKDALTRKADGSGRR